MATKKNIEQDALTGAFFHSINDKGYVEWQGMVIGHVRNGLYLVQLFSWLCGDDSNCTLVPLETMRTWLFYQNQESMVHSYEYGVAKRKQHPPCLLKPAPRE